MKKLVLAAALAGVSTLAVANTGYYVQGNVGYSKLEFKDSEFKLKDSGASYGVAVGKKVGDMRYALDYTNFGKIKVSENEERVENFIDTGVNNVTEHYKGEVTTHSLGLSAIYDFAPV
ncbi:opacity family porin, partial [Moraxella caviae]